MWCLLCDMDGGLQPHVPQQSQPLPEPPSLLSAGNHLLRRRHRARHQETKGQNIFPAHSTWRRRLSFASEQASESVRRAAYGFHARGGGRGRKQCNIC